MTDSRNFHFSKDILHAERLESLLYKFDPERADKIEWLWENKPHIFYYHFGLEATVDEIVHPVNSEKWLNNFTSFLKIKILTSAFRSEILREIWRTNEGMIRELISKTVDPEQSKNMLQSLLDTHLQDDIYLKYADAFITDILKSCLEHYGNQSKKTLLVKKIIKSREKLMGPKEVKLEVPSKTEVEKTKVPCSKTSKRIPEHTSKGVKKQRCQNKVRDEISHTLNENEPVLPQMPSFNLPPEYNQSNPLPPLWNELEFGLREWSMFSLKPSQLQGLVGKNNVESSNSFSLKPSSSTD